MMQLLHDALNLAKKLAIKCGSTEIAHNIETIIAQIDTQKIEDDE